MPIDDRRVTLKDIAEKTGFTVNTVSQALRGSPKLREETKAAIRAAAKELGYVHNALAGSLRSGSSRTIAIIVGDTSNLRFSIQLHAFELAFRTLGYQAIVMNTDETAQYELDAVKNAVRSSVDGVLLCPCQKSRAAIDLLESCRTPYVLFGRCYDDLPAVIWDDERGGYLAGQQLAQAGCQHILMLNVPDSISSARERESGFRRALGEAELTPHLLRTAPGGADLEPALGRYLDRYGCPDGIFAFSDLLALDAACCLQGRGIRIPQDIRIIGFDDILSHIRLPFPLSSVSADKTLETLRTFAAIDARFAELGGELTAEQTQVADNYAQQLMDQYGSTYTANGIGLETLKAFERIQLKHTLLLTLVYGPDGESPVDDSDLTEHLDSQMYELAYVNIPLYNTSTFVFASDDQKAQMLQLAQAAAASCSETQDGSVSEQVSALHSAASAALPDIYAVLDSTPAEDASSVQTELLTESDLTGAFTQDGAADAVRGLVYGEAAAVQYNAASIILMMRIDPLQVSTLDALRTQILSDMKGDELEDALTAYGSTLENDLSTSAMNKMPASKIVNPSSSSNS